MPSALVVDDDTDLRHLMSALLRGAGFDVRAETDGDSALAAALEMRPDVVLLDWLLPARSGLEVCRELRERSDLASTIIILVSARDGAVDLELGYASGPDDFLVKPFVGADLVARVQQALERRDHTQSD